MAKLFIPFHIFQNPKLGYDVTVFKISNVLFKQKKRDIIEK